MGERPGQRLATRPLHFIWIADCSGSMAGDGKIQALNNAVCQTIPHLQDVAAQNPYATMLVRALAFSTGVRWHIGRPTPVEDLSWPDLKAWGYTDMGAALAEVASQLRVSQMEVRALPPALVLISDGQPTDDFGAGLDALLSEPWGAKAVRLAVAIGRDADLGVLARFIGDSRIPPLSANDPDQLANQIRFASTVAVKVASRPSAMPGQEQPPIEVPVLSSQVSGDITW